MLHHFTYLAPRTRAELHSVLADEGAAASLLAGGTDLLVNIRAGLARPKIVVDAKKVEGFAGIAWSERDGLVIRAGVTINAVLADARIAATIRCSSPARTISPPIRSAIARRSSATWSTPRRAPTWRRRCCACAPTR